MTAPTIPGYALVWVDEFNGASGAAVDGSKWNSKTGPNSNHEVQQYTTSTDNAHLSGDGRLYIIPNKDGSGHWTSARLEGRYSFNCDAGHQMIFQAEICLGNNPPAQQQGLWPAFWTLGAAVRTGVGWPKCGEWDILEIINGSSTNQGTLHYLNSSNVDPGFGGRVNFSHNDYHTWALKVDRTAGTFQGEKLTWSLDGNPFFEVTGARVNNAEQWDDVAHKAYFPILNLAVGGDYPGQPNDQTTGGFQSGMQVKYVGVYKSNT